MSFYYISKNDIVNLNSLSENEDFWILYELYGNYSAAMNTRSLSINLFSTINFLFNFDFNKNSIINIILLFYENPNGKISALLYRFMNIINENPQVEKFQQDQWIDIINQENKILSNEFYNAFGFNYNNTLYKISGYNITFSRTLYEADPIVVYSIPFFNTFNFLYGSVSAMFYSLFNLPLNTTFSLVGDSFFIVNYGIGLIDPENFSLTGMHYTTLYTELFRGIIVRLVSTPSSKDYISIHQSDIAIFGSDHGIWINGTHPALISTEYTGTVSTFSSNEFLFKKFVNITLTDGSAIYLYHQMNGAIFVEEQ